MVSRWWVWFIIGLCLGAGVAFAAILAITMPVRQAGVGYVALVQLSGTISYSESPLTLLSGEVLTPSEVKELVRRIESNRSPGGCSSDQ